MLPPADHPRASSTAAPSSRDGPTGPGGLGVTPLAYMSYVTYLGSADGSGGEAPRLASRPDQDASLFPGGENSSGVSARQAATGRESELAAVAADAVHRPTVPRTPGS